MAKTDTNADTKTGALVNAKALAAAMCRHPNTIYRWVKEQKVPFKRVFGVGLLFDIDEVKAVVFDEKAG